jgi:lipoic acid synthetase
MKHRPKLPPWIRVRVGSGEGRKEVASILKELNLNTVCGSAECPNLAECWQKRTATFMILGNECTRNCRFCAVNHNATPLPIDPAEPANIAEAVRRMNLKYVVITSVTRDDLKDGGSQQFADTINEIRKIDPKINIEVLTPDYQGENLKTVILASPKVFNHNIETVERLSKEIRVKANYQNSMKTLTEAVALSEDKILVNSGLMVGLGETDSEVEKTICDIRKTGTKLLTIGQYLPPSKEHWNLKRYVEPEVFEHWRIFALEKGFTNVASAPLVRSSYHAEDLHA